MKMFLGYLYFLAFLLMTSDGYEGLQNVVKKCRNQTGSSRKRVLILMVGLSKSGKTWLVENSPTLRKLFQIKTNLIHELLREEFPELKDETVGTLTYWLVQFLTTYVRKNVLEGAMDLGFDIVLDSCNLTWRKRQKWLALAKRYSYRSVIIEIYIAEILLQTRIDQAATDQIKANQQVTWPDVYEQQQKAYQRVAWYEGDYVLRFQSEVTGVGEFESRLKLFFSSCVS